LAASRLRISFSSETFYARQLQAVKFRGEPIEDALKLTPRTRRQSGEAAKPWFANIHLAWKTKDLVISDAGIGIQPTSTLETINPNECFHKK
jgi:hypothetical protein